MVQKGVSIIFIKRPNNFDVPLIFISQGVYKLNNEGKEADFIENFPTSGKEGKG